MHDTSQASQGVSLIRDRKAITTALATTKLFTGGQSEAQNRQRRYRKAVVKVRRRQRRSVSRQSGAGWILLTHVMTTGDN